MPLQSLPVRDTAGKHPAPSEPTRPRVKRRKGLNLLSDAEVWNFSDQDILDAASSAWRSSVYEHYELSLERFYAENGSADRLGIRFNCKFREPSHHPFTRDQMRNCDGTRNLLASARACDVRRGVIVLSDDDHTLPDSHYSEPMHRAILAIRCCRDKRPYKSVVDPLHLAEVQLLRPGTALPCAATVSNDVKHLYPDASVDVARFLQNAPGVLHLAVDGWTCPRSESFLGVVVFWTIREKVDRAILEFVRLDQSHTGRYMADRVHDCLKRYKIEQKIMSICLDNAASNNMLVNRLQELVPTFRGQKARTRCFPHIINLMAKSFISLFFAVSKRSKGPRVTEAPSTEETIDTNRDTESDVDPGKLEHEEQVVQSTVVEAKAIMAAAGVRANDEELSKACQIMPKVAGLARRVNDSPPLATQFRELAEQDKELDGDSRALRERTPTRWNSDRTALESHLHFKAQVQMLTGNSRLKLKKYALDEEEWDYADELCAALEVFQEPTDRFSQSGIPLVHEVLPELLTVGARLQDIRDDVLKLGLRPVTRIAAQAALLVFNKYLGALNESDVYVTSIVMCPNRKLQWFASRGYDIAPIRARVVDAFNALFPQPAENAIRTQRDRSNDARNTTRTRGVWTQRHSSLATPPAQAEAVDTIEAYLDSPVVSTEVVDQHGGVLLYWNSRRASCSRVARMALNYLTVPASSVDAERAFSGGRLMVNHLQHRMSSQSFQAQMAVGSWYGTDLLPSLDRAAKIIEDTM